MVNTHVGEVSLLIQSRFKSRLFRFLLSKFLINLRRKFRVRKIFRTQVFAGFAGILCLKLLYQKCVTYVVGCSFIKTCSIINRLLTSVFVLANRIVFSGSNGLIIQCLTACLMN